MKRILLVIICLAAFSICIPAQDDKLITVMAGTKVISYFPVQERYRYPAFMEGQVQFRNGTANTGRFNYNFLLGEMDFIQGHDTLTVANRKNISLITVDQNVFYCYNGYLELIFNGQVKVGLKQYFKLKDVLKKGALGTTNRSVSIESYIPVTRGNYYGWIPNEDCVFQKTQEYYFATPDNNFMPFSRKNVLQSFPQHEDTIRGYLKSNKVSFSSSDDLVRLAEYLEGLIS